MPFLPRDQGESGQLAWEDSVGAWCRGGLGTSGLDVQEFWGGWALGGGWYLWKVIFGKVVKVFPARGFFIVYVIDGIEEIVE